MTELVLDGRTMRSLADLHDQVVRNPETPDFYGRNLDALSDVVTGFFTPPVLVQWCYADVARHTLGTEFDRALAVFQDAAEEMRLAGQVFKVEVFAEAPPPRAGEDS